MFAGRVRGIFVPEVPNFIIVIARGGVILSIKIWPFLLNNLVFEQNMNNGCNFCSPNTFK